MTGIEIAKAFVTVVPDMTKLEAGFAASNAQTKQWAAQTQAATKAVEASSARASRVTGANWTAMGTKAEAAGRKVKTASLAAAGLGIVAGKLAIDFDRSMRNVNSIAQLPERQFARLERQVLRMAGPTAQMPRTLAEGLYDLVSSGFNARQSMTVLNASARAATAGLTTTEVSTKAVAAALNAYRRPAAHAGIVSDVLFKTVDRGVITFDELASTIGYVLPAASTMGIGIKQVGGAISTLTKQGQSGSNAVVNLNAAITAMIKPSRDMEGVLRKLGIANLENVVRARGFQRTLQLLIGATDGTKKAIGELFPNVRAMRSVFGLTGANARSAAADLRDFQGSAGATARVLAEQSKSISFQWNQLKANAAALAIEVGMKLLPIFVDMFGALGSLLEGFSSLPGPMQDVVAVAIALTAAMYPILLIAGKLMRGWGLLIGLGTKIELSLTGQAAAATRAAAANAQLAASTTAAAGAQRQLLIANSSGTVTGSRPIGGAPTTVAGGAGRASKYLNRFGTGALIGLGGMSLGGMMGGAGGSFVSGASAGAGLGMMGGPMGALAGGMIGGTAANIATLIGQLKAAKKPQDKLAESSREVAKWMQKQRTASAGVSAATQNVAAAQRRAHTAAQRLRGAERHLLETRRRFGPNSEQARQAEYRLAQARHQSEKRTRELNRAERLQGVSLQQYKAVTRSTMAEQRHRIALLRRQSERLAEIFKREKAAGASNQRLADIGRRGLRVTAELKKVQGDYTRTLREAAQVAGARWANAMRHMSTAMLAFGRRIPSLEPRLTRLGNNPAPRKLAAAFADMGRKLDTMTGNVRRNTERSGRLFLGLGTTGTNALGGLGQNANRFSQAFGGPAVNFRVGGVGKHAMGGKVTKPIAVMGEEAPRHHEWVIATNPAYKERNVGYWAAAGADLGVPGFARGGKHGGLPHPRILGPQPAAGIAQGPVDHGYKAASSWLQRQRDAQSSIGGIPGYIGPPANMKQLGDNAWVDSHTLAVASLLAKKFGLTLQSAYRSISHNAAVGGVEGSLHTHGSPRNPGALDFTPPSQRALAWAIKHIAGLQEAMIHDAGSGMHIHLGFFRKGGKVGDWDKLTGSHWDNNELATLAHVAGIKSPGRMAQIGQGESRGKRKAVGNDAAAGYGRTFGLGLWQITTGVGNDDLINSFGGRNAMFHPWFNAKAAKYLLDNGGVMGPPTWYAPPVGPIGQVQGTLAGQMRSIVGGGSGGARELPRTITARVPVGTTHASGGTSVALRTRRLSTERLDFGSLPDSVNACRRELGQRRAELARYRAARGQYKDHPDILRSIEANIRALISRIGALRKQLYKLLRARRIQRFGSRISKAAEFADWNTKIAGVERSFNRANEYADQLVALEPVEGPGFSGDFSSVLRSYIEGREAPAYGAVLGIEGTWRNSLIGAEAFAEAKAGAWRGQIGRLHDRVVEIQGLRGRNPKAWRKHRGKIPELRAKMKMLRGAIQTTRGEQIPAWNDMLDQVQGIGRTKEMMGSIPSTPDPDLFGGQIFATQVSIRDLGLRVADAAAGGSSGGVSDSDQAIVDFAKQIVEEKRQRDLIARVQSGALSSMPPYAGSFYGGVDRVPGPVGAPRRAIIHGGERVVPADESAGSQVTIVIEDGAVDASKIRVIAEDAVDVKMRRGGRRAGRRQPGRPGL